MPSDAHRPLDLEGWLTYISSVHPREIELGLSRVQTVGERLGVVRPQSTVVTVAGTNGKGSTVAALNAMLLAEGAKVGTYTSPHIHRFNERIQIDGISLSDSVLCELFSEIDSARNDISLSYFEFATLAALLSFKNSSLDVIVLEVGLGGRLDAVNIVNADIAVITSISLDHEDWLGSDLEIIGGEKAGILRRHKPIVYGHTYLPNSIRQKAIEFDCQLFQFGKEFDLRNTGQDDALEWNGKSVMGLSKRYSSIPPQSLHLGSVAAAIQVLELLELSPLPENGYPGLANLSLAGRFEQRVDCNTQINVLLDVAHNPAAAKDLAVKVEVLRKNQSSLGKISVVFAALGDKDIEGIVVSLQSLVDIWYIAEINDSRSIAMSKIADLVKSVCPDSEIEAVGSIQDTYNRACKNASETDLVVVLGSFHTVAAARELTRAI